MREEEASDELCYHSLYSPSSPKIEINEAENSSDFINIIRETMWSPAATNNDYNGLFLLKKKKNDEWVKHAYHSFVLGSTFWFGFFEKQKKKFHCIRLQREAKRRYSRNGKMFFLRKVLYKVEMWLRKFAYRLLEAGLKIYLSESEQRILSHTPIFFQTTAYFNMHVNYISLPWFFLFYFFLCRSFLPHSSVH